jgi:hypothetical protein
LDSGSSDDRFAPRVTEHEQAPAPAEAPAVQRFHACRWRRTAENGTPEHCGHRDVLPMAGTTGFAPDSWCPDCAYFKAKRTPRKPPDRDEQYRW